MGWILTEEARHGRDDWRVGTVVEDCVAITVGANVVALWESGIAHPDRVQVIAPEWR